MAKPSWIKTSPSSGSGNATVVVSSTTEHTGRVARTGILTFKAANVANVERTVNQAGKVVTISGVSNSKKLTFSVGAGDLMIAMPMTYMANSLVTVNGENISGDPGASAEYPFSISINVPANTSTSSMSRQIIVTDEAGHTDVCTLTSAAGDAYLNVQLGDIELDYKGTAVNVTVESNTSWTVE